MSKTIDKFNDVIYKIRKEVLGKDADKLHIVFTEDMVILASNEGLHRLNNACLLRQKMRKWCI